MKKSICLALIILLMIILCMPIPTNAAPEDLGIEFTVFPEVAGWKGADIQITITAENYGSTPITWLDVGVTTIAGYNQRWTGTINPGSSRAIAFIIPFEADDFDTDKLLTVAMNNDSDANPDGTQVRTFQVESCSPIFNSTLSISPNRSTYNVGDTVEFSHTFHNTIVTHAATGVTSRCYLVFEDGSEMVCNPGVITHGMVMPDASITNTFSYTFTEDDVGRISAAYVLSFTMMGEDYQRLDSTAVFNVEEIEEVYLAVSFIAHLSATPTEIDAGDTVLFSVGLQNTGLGTIDTFEVRNIEGELIADLEGLTAGNWASYEFSVDIHETTDASYIVTGISDPVSETVETNTVHITVREPEVSPSSSPTEAVDITVITSPSPSLLIDTAITQTPLSTSIDNASDNDSSESKDNSALLYIIIAVLGVLVLAGIVTIPILLHNKKK